MKQLFKVVAQQEPTQVTKQDGSILNKCTIVLQEIGGKYENSYVCQLLGNAAVCKFYNEITVQDIISFSHHN